MPFGGFSQDRIPLVPRHIDRGTFQPVEEFGFQLRPGLSSLGFADQRRRYSLADAWPF
jgi:hypothetical protein